MTDFKPLAFRGSSLDDLRAFPVAARREAGFQIDLVQHGQEPDDYKPMPGIGAGVREIRVRDATGKPDLELAESRYRDLRKELGK